MSDVNSMTREELEALQAQLADPTKQMRDVFNENLQNTFQNSLIRRLSIQAMISKKVFIPLVMQIPFNPFTGKTDENYGMAKKWVTATSPRKIMMAIKDMCNRNPELKEAYIHMANYKNEWDTSNVEVCDTPADKAILWIYRRPMAYTFPVMTVNNTYITGQDYGQTYLLKTEQDPMTGAFIGEPEFMHLMASMIGALAQKEVKAFKDALKNNNANNLCKLMGRPFTGTNDYLAMSADSNEAKERAREIRKFYPMSSPYSAISFPVLAFDLTPRSGELFVEDEKTGEHVLLEHFREYKDFDPEKYLYYNGTMGIREEVDNICGNYFPRNPANIKERNKDKDLYPNWVVLDYVLNDTRTELTKEERFALSQRLKFAQEGTSMYSPRKKSWEAPELEGFVAALEKFYDLANDRDFIRTIRGWIASEYQEITPVLEDAAINYVKNHLHISLPVYDVSIKAKYNDVLKEIFHAEQALFATDNLDFIEKKSEDFMTELRDEALHPEGKKEDEDDDDAVDLRIVE